MKATERQMKEFLCSSIGLAPTEHLRVIGRENSDGELVAVVGFDNYNGSAIEMHVASRGSHWMTKSFLRAAFEYPFVTCGCKVVIGIVPSGNVKALDLNKRLGFWLKAIIRDGHPDGELYIYTMRREDCRWIKAGS